MKNWKNRLLGYVAIGLTCTMIGSAATLAVRLGSGGSGEVVNLISALFATPRGASSGGGSGSRKATPL